MEFEPMLTPREKTLYRKVSPEEVRARDTVDSEPKHYQRAIPAPVMNQSWEESLASIRIRAQAV